MVDPDWKEVEGTIGKSVYFTVNDCDGVAEDLSPYDEAKIQLKVFRNEDSSLKFEKDMNYVTDGTDGRVVAVLNLATDVAIGDEASYFFLIELETAGGIIVPTLRGTFQIVQGAPA